MLKGSVYCNVSRTTALVVGLLLGLLPTITQADVNTNLFGNTPGGKIAPSGAFDNEDSNVASGILNTAYTRVFQLLLYLATAAAVVMIVYSGIKLIQSGGNDEQAKEAKRAVLYIVVGIIVLSSVFVIIKFGGSFASFLVGETTTF